MAWTNPSDKITGDVVTAAIWNASLGATGNMAQTAAAKVTTAGDITYATAANTLARLGIGSSAQVLTVSGGVPAWATGSSLTLSRLEFLDQDLPMILQSNNGTFTANTAYFVPAKAVTAAVTVTHLAIRLGTQSGNIDAGIYSWDGTTMTRVVSLGSTACPATSTNASLNIADTALSPGTRYFFAWAADNATVAASTMANQAVLGAQPLQFWAWGYQKASSFPLPSTVASLTAYALSMPQMVGQLSGGVQVATP